MVKLVTGKKRTRATGKPRYLKTRGSVARAAGGFAKTEAPALLNFKELARFLDGIAIESEASERGISPREVVDELPRETFSLASGRFFLAVMDNIAGWGPVSIPLNLADGVVEFHLVLPFGEIGNDYFYWLKAGPVRGRFRIDQCAAIAFVERPFLGRPSAAVLFLNRAGNIMFKVFLARDESHQLDPNQLAAFRALAKRFSRRRRLPSGAANSRRGRL